jgi:Magnesium chelatase, subunit ChlI
MGREGWRVWHGHVRLLVRDRDHTVNRKVNRMLVWPSTPILPAISLVEVTETRRIYRVGEHMGDRTALMRRRPYRAPHHTVSDVGLIGGGHVPMPGDVSRAHHGVLFLDARPEFRRHVLEVLRQPLEKSVRKCSGVPKLLEGVIEAPAVIGLAGLLRHGFVPFRRNRPGIRIVSNRVEGRPLTVHHRHPRRQRVGPVRPRSRRETR